MFGSKVSSGANAKLTLYLPTGWREATGAGAIAARYNEVLRGLLKADSLSA